MTLPKSNICMSAQLKVIDHSDPSVSLARVSATWAPRNCERRPGASMARHEFEVVIRADYRPAQS
jgi:hypothetical protein